MDPKQAAAVITAYINSRDIDVPDSVRAAAFDFARGCRELNARLVVCEELLKANQRSEAIRQVQLEPDALQMYAALDIPNGEWWSSAAGQVGLPVPPPLNVAAARNLHKAFTAEQAVKDLLIQHRLLAVSRAPLKRRLDIVRLLAKAEPMNLGWSTDVRAYETARFDELRTVLNDPDQSEDWDIVQGVYNELVSNSKGWVTPPPVDLVGTSIEAYNGFREQEAVDRLTELKPQLERALSDGDLAGTKRAVARIHATVKKYDVSKSGKPFSRLRSLLDQAEKWIEGEEEYIRRTEKFETAVGDLRYALKKNIDSDHIRRCYEVVLGFDEFDVPQDLANEYEAWSRARSLWVWVGVIAGITAVLIGVALYFVLIRK